MSKTRISTARFSGRRRACGSPTFFQPLGAPPRRCAPRYITLVRDELALIRELTLEIDKLRGTSREPEAGQITLPFPELPIGASRADDVELPPFDFSRLTPESAEEIISERLAAWERVWQSQWRKISGLMSES